MMGSSGKSAMGWWGEYRARVVEVDIEGNAYGAVRVFIPDLMAGSLMKQGDKKFNEHASGLIAYPANNPIGGYNSDDSAGSSSYQGSLHVPLKGSYVWVRFEGGDPSRPFYTGAFMYRGAKVPPECRNIAEPHKSYLLCKTHSGRAIVVCDSPDQQRVEITGKKRTMSGGMEGDGGSVYGMKGNMTTILLDERPGKEKILFSSHKGDYIHFDIDERLIQVDIKNGIRLKTEGDIDLDVKGDIRLKVGGNILVETGGDMSMKNDGNNILESDGAITSKSGVSTAIDSGGVVAIQLPINASAPEVVPIPPMGARST